MDTNTETHSGRLHMGTRTFVEALRRVATILQVCSHVLPSASRLHNTLNVLFVFTSHLERHIQVEERVLYFLRLVQFRVVLFCPICLFFDCLRDYPRSGKFAQFSLLCQASFRCVGVKDFICT